MVSVESLSPNDIEDILREVDPKRQFSETEISSVTKSLNDTLADYALSEEERDIEPTARELNKQIDALESALKRLKMALPKPGQRSLFNFLVRAGEVYAKTNGPHPNVKRQTVYAWDPRRDLEVSFELDHFHSDQRLQQMVDSVTQLLAWIDHAPRMDEINWVDNTPYWRDEENMFERLENQDEFLRSVDAHRIRQTKRLIGHRLPGLYETTFGEKFTVSRSDDGTPGLRFVIGVLRHAGITRENGTELSIDTVIKYRSMAKKDLLRQQRNLPPPPLYKRD